MRRESSTVVALVGEVAGDLVAGLGLLPNVAVARAPAAASGQSVTAAACATASFSTPLRWYQLAAFRCRPRVRSGDSSRSFWRSTSASKGW